MEAWKKGAIIGGVLGLVLGLVMHIYYFNVLCKRSPAEFEIITPEGAETRLPIGYSSICTPLNELSMFPSPKSLAKDLSPDQTDVVITYLGTAFTLLISSAIIFGLLLQLSILILALVGALIGYTLFDKIKITKRVGFWKK